MNIRRRKTPEPHIPFISLADIAWQIIIFFLVASTFALNSSMNLDIPSANDKQQAKSAPAKTITVQATENAVMIDGKPVSFNQIQSQIAELLKGKKSEQDRAVIIEGKQDLTFQRDVDIMYAIQQRRRNPRDGGRKIAPFPSILAPPAGRGFPRTQ